MCIQVHNSVHIDSRYLSVTYSLSSSNFFINSRISITRHALVRTDSLTGFGALPIATQPHQVDLPIGMTLNTSGKRR